MAKTPSRMLALGTQAPYFSLPDTEGKLISLNDFNKQPLLVMFICNHCPYVIHIQKELTKLTNEYLNKNLSIVAINSNDIKNYPDDSPEKMKLEKNKVGYSFPYLFDETQEVAKQYQAACTPDFFLFNSSHKLVYRGQYDDSRPGNGISVTGKDLKQAIDFLLQNKPMPSDQKPSLGCNIKWKPGNEPK